MSLSHKCLYALRALFELARRRRSGCVSVAQIAEAQAIPPRFLELILAELKQAGYVLSRRGAQGGYQLAVLPEEIPVGDVIRLIEGPMNPVDCMADPADANCPLQGRCAFLDLWRRAREAVETIYDQTTLADLLQQDQSAKQVLNYCI